MTESYSYPLDLTWSADEMATVVAFFNQVETFYENPRTLSADSFRLAYRAFKKVVPSKAQEKQLDRAFKEASGYSTYEALKALTRADRD
jgi:uncharacterized protein YktA (UPF0223 family)